MSSRPSLWTRSAGHSTLAGQTHTTCSSRSQLTKAKPGRVHYPSTPLQLTRQSFHGSQHAAAQSTTSITEQLLRAKMTLQLSGTCTWHRAPTAAPTLHRAPSPLIQTMSASYAPTAPAVLRGHGTYLTSSKTPSTRSTDWLPSSTRTIP